MLSSWLPLVAQPAAQSSRPPLHLLPSHDWQQVRRLVLRYGWHTNAYQLLNAGIEHWFTPNGEGVVGYVTTQGYRIVAGEPVCPPAQLHEVIQAFLADAHSQGQRVCFVAAQERLAATLDTGLTAYLQPMTIEQGCLLLGAQPVWQPHTWRERLQGKSSLRAQLSRARNKHIEVVPWPVEQAANHPELQHCLAAWMQTRRLPPLGFMVDPNTLDNLADRQIFVAQRDRAVMGFLVASPIPRRNGWLIEQIIRTPQAPNGTTELLLDTAMRALAEQGATYATLGLSPLSQRSGIWQPSQPAWLRLLLVWLQAHGNRFYNFAGLDAFKAKFRPAWWEPVYAITPDHSLTPQTVVALLAAFGNGAPLSYVVRGLAWSAAQESRWAWAQLQQQRT